MKNMSIEAEQRPRAGPGEAGRQGAQRPSASQPANQPPPPQAGGEDQGRQAGRNRQAGNGTGIEQRCREEQGIEEQGSRGQERNGMDEGRGREEKDAPDGSHSWEAGGARQLPFTASPPH
ncbi:hypothetical protein E2C01_100516 [Portunus trituberculatus]|uniref:Uncharacterized protein n=1 Tax=Portunus trituberculatus TaxID=210409 RepID=A0A5B7KDR2_PORTR|nr:hypothetical protein [Portunus trituberculatus]